MWQTCKITAISDNGIEAQDSQKNKISIPKYPSIYGIKVGEEINIFVSKDKSGLIKKVLKELISTKD